METARRTQQRVQAFLTYSAEQAKDQCEKPLSDHLSKKVSSLQVVRTFSNIYWPGKVHTHPVSQMLRDNLSPWR